MKHLFQGEERGFWGKEKINSLGWSYYFLFILLILFSPAYFPDFNLSYSFSILLPSIFQHVLRLFSQCLIFQTPRSIASNQWYLHYILSFSYFFKASLWILLQRNHGTNYYAWSSDSKSRHIWNEGYEEAVWWLRVHILETGGFAFAPTHSHLLAMTRPVCSFTTLSWTSSRSYKELVTSSSWDCWGLLR